MDSRHQTDADFPQMKFGSVWLDVDWEAFQIPRGFAPAPPDRTIAWSQQVARQRSGRLREFLKPTGRYNPRIRISQVPDPDAPDAELVEAYDFIDRAWEASELPLMIKEAERILSRTGFATHYEQHFLVRRSGAWFIFADPGMPADRDAVEERYSDDVVFADPTRFEWLPEEIADAAGGLSGRLAWAMEVLKRSKGPARFDRRAELEVSPVGRIGHALGDGRGEEAAAHVSWLLAEAYRAGWSDGAYFEQVRVSDAIAQNLKEITGAQQSSGRSQAKQRRRAACAAFICANDPQHTLSTAALARLIHQAAAAKDPIFAGIALLDRHEPENPRETAKEISEMRGAQALTKGAFGQQSDLAATFVALLAGD
ncbi:hypothetical protein D3C86_1169760 [compost metagenome]